MSDQFTSVRVSTLRGDQKINFDVYVKISDKYLLYLKAGDSFEGERLERLRKKKLKKMYIRFDHEKLYRDYVQRNIENAYQGNSKMSIENRAQIIQGDQQARAEEVMENPESGEAYLQAKVGAQQLYHFLRQEPSGLAQILRIKNFDSSVAHHGVNVAGLAQSLATVMGWQDTQMLSLIGLGALIHDIDHAQSGFPFARPRSLFEEHEQQFYREHPRRGAISVQDKRHFDSQVVKIIMQHEETIDGKGFPNGLIEGQMDPLALIVGAANFADRLMSWEGIAARDLSKTLMVMGVGKYPLDVLKNLSLIIEKNWGK
ncbi:MAG: HDIG domain-containing protein [Bdellovibrionaceae bacterium]|nr:HDIG domain-containing protein [Pseudobdellovibrionaceae bacterium]MDW8190202.1 HD domain-containing phosphohydrolase [Pseudobdellovibrionaceae bacterium]